MSNRCSICLAERRYCFKAKILNKYTISYFYCDRCGFLQTEEPYWLEEAYSSAIADADTGLIARNISISKKLGCILFFLLDKEGKYLDLAGGYGILARLMRDVGFDFYWSDLYCQNVFSKGFDESTAHKPFTAITAFEVLEHIYNPLSFIQDALNKSETSTIIFSTELFLRMPPDPEQWWYYTLGTGQHISFFQARTLQYIANELSLFLYSNKNIHVITNESVNKMRLLKLLTGKPSHILQHYVKIRMASKTNSDHKILIKNLSNDL
ncbi:MAG: class I SAM-dependent methyltransferase [Myxacorys californica WJT36-NPBG1]|jgi:2-polyprenyl-3-methyl-5-hydroxy-6-metoxy-1,4-benzoquinol methylase|nr:class I SAM-dependent methyltransferase [Myxacorys californica WJT36-NPBG1]